ncbi:MAG TPA: RNA 2',3'-cyclic phosphodiesterase [Streptosporangiaceae bacterium]|nr:RNA 2',3'-cyclic phosphodiesterase [Streptosporangiaceae bacterium]
MRLFVAVTPPDGALAELEHAVSPLRAAAPELRWTGMGSWHLTLAFLGEVREEVLTDLKARLERAAHRHPAQRLAIAGGGAFPSARRAQVLWAGFAADDKALAALADSVAAGARRAGAPPPGQHRRYRAHLTLARCRSPADVSALTQALAGFSGSAWTATSVHLIRSQLSSGPPQYEDLAAWPLQQPAAQSRSST